MCTSYLIWYIADGQTPGVIVLLFVFTFCETYFVLIYPRFTVIALISMVTQVLVVGYELQVRKVGVQVRILKCLPYLRNLLLTLQNRWPRAADSLRIRSTNWHLTDLHACQGACLSHSSGHFSHILSLLDRGCEKTSEAPCIYLPISILVYILRSASV